MFYRYLDPGFVTITSVSSDGNYAVTTNLHTTIILWDLKNHTRQYISHNGNIYSAYFIKNSNQFIWQDLNNVVHVQDVNGKEIKNFNNFPVYGQVMSKGLKNYFSCNENLDLYSGFNSQQYLVLTNGNHDGFIAGGKILNLTLSSDNKYLFTSGRGGDYSSEGLNDENFILWNLKPIKLKKRLVEGENNLFGTLSPDNKFIIGGDEDGSNYVWQINGKKLLNFDIYSEHTPSEFDEPVEGVFTLKFIDNENHYLRFTTEIPYATLFSVTSPTPIKYYNLDENPLPSIGVGSDYASDESIDTAPAAHILVTGQNSENGINVYQFDPKTLSLHRIWVGKA